MGLKNEMLVTFPNCSTFDGRMLLIALYWILAMSREKILHRLLPGESCGTYETGVASDVLCSIILYSDAF